MTGMGKVNKHAKLVHPVNDSTSYVSQPCIKILVV